MTKRLNIVKISSEQIAEFIELDDKHHVIRVFVSPADEEANTLSIIVKGPKCTITNEYEQMEYVTVEQLGIRMLQKNPDKHD